MSGRPSPAGRTLGTPIAHPEDLLPQDPDAPGMDWSLSDGTLADIEAIEAIARDSRARAPSFLVD